MTSQVKSSLAATAPVGFSKPHKSAIKHSSNKRGKEKTQKIVWREDDSNQQYIIVDIWNAPKVPRSVLRELIHEVTAEILHRGTKKYNSLTVYRFNTNFHHFFFFFSF